MNAKHCPNCDYAVESRLIELAYFNAPCPRCKAANLNDFYSLNSMTHINRREAWERGEIEGRPPKLCNTDEAGEGKP